MRLRGRQARFLALVLGGWVLMRAAATWPVHETPIRIAAMVVDAGDEAPTGRVVPTRASVTEIPATLPLAKERIVIPPRHPELDPGSARDVGESRLVETQKQQVAGPRIKSGVTAREAVAASLPPYPPAPATSAGRRIEAQAYVFLRPGSGRALASGSALGGSQAAARIAVPIDVAGRFAAAARVYAPLRSAGAEGAIGIDWRPLAGVPLRVSIERRQRLDNAGRSAWSGYMAGGFYRALPGKLLFDGYAQAGIVGTRRRDLFADGALRLERAVPIGRANAGVGAGIWGAAQPQAERLDAGPRASFRLPVADHTLSLAVEGRFRLAGRARPGSGVTVTLAADL